MTDPALLDALRTITTATITTLLFKRGLRQIYLRQTRPLRPGQGRAVGPAFTLRFIPAREDLASPAAWSSPVSTRTAIEAMPPGVIAVADAQRCTDAGVAGDILCARMHQRGVAALVTDGALRDVEGVRATPLPVWSAGNAAPPAVAALHFVAWQQPIACGGVAIFPDDIIVADDDGAVVIPAALAPEIAAHGPAQEREEVWIMSQIAQGHPLPGLYPMTEETRARYAQSSTPEKQ